MRYEAWGMRDEVIASKSVLIALLLAALSAQAQPRIDRVSPSQGPIAGGTVVAVSGAGFAGASMTVDRTAIAPLSQSDSEIRLVMPKHDHGYAVISVRSGAAAASGEFLYTAPALADLAPGAITTIAGVGNYLRDFGRASEATVQPGNIAVDGAGNVFIAQPGPNTILRVTPDGAIERFAGNGEAFGTHGAGIAALDASFSFPTAVAVDPHGYVYVPDHRGRLCRVDPQTRIVTSLAGNGREGYSGDGGPAADAQIGLPAFIAADAENVYFIDFPARRIRRIRDGIITTFAGNGIAGFSGDGGPATSASYDIGDSDSGALALDSAGHLFLGDAFNKRIRRIDRVTGIITTFVDARAQPFDVGTIRALAFDGAGNLYYSGGGTIVKVSPSGAFLTSWRRTAETPSLEDDVPFADAYIGHVVGLAIDRNGDVLYADDQIQRVRRLNQTTGRITTVAGIGPRQIGRDGPAAGAYLAPNDVAFNSAGELLIADACCGPGGGGIRKIGRDGKLTTIMGVGIALNNAHNVPALEASTIALSLDVDAAGSIDFVDGTVVYRLENGIVRVLNKPDATCAYDGDAGPASQAHVCQPWDAVRDRDGHLFIADTNNNRIRRIDRATGVITTFAGNGQPPNGFERYGNGISCGDGGPALTACLDTPYGLAFDASGSLFVSESFNIRRIDPNGTISTFASDAGVTKLVFDGASNLYGGRHDALLRFRSTGERTVIAGTAASGYSGDGGPASAASVSFSPLSGGIAVDAEGNVFFCDGLSRVRAIRYGAVLAPAGATVQASADGSSLRATVFDAAGRPTPGVRVDFTAPASGASCILASAFAITDANGVAAVSCARNCIAGAYGVVARPLGSSASATIPRVNADDRCRRRSVRH